MAAYDNSDYALLELADESSRGQDEQDLETPEDLPAVPRSTRWPVSTGRWMRQRPPVDLRCAQATYFVVGFNMGGMMIAFIGAAVFLAFCAGRTCFSA